MKPLNRFVVINIKDHEVDVVLNTWIKMEDDPPTYRRPADQIQFCEAIMNEIEPEKNWEKIPFSRVLKSFTTLPEAKAHSKLPNISLMTDPEDSDALRKSRGRRSQKQNIGQPITDSRDHNVTPLSSVSNAIKRHMASLHRNWNQTDSGFSKWFVEQQKAGRFVGMKNPWDPNKKGQRTSTTSTSKKTGKRTKGVEKIVSSSESEEEKSVQEEESDSELPTPPKKLKVTDATFDSDTSPQNTKNLDNKDEQSTEDFGTSSQNTNDLDNNGKQSNEDENSLMISINKENVSYNEIVRKFTVNGEFKSDLIQAAILVGLRTNHKKIASIEYRLGTIERKLASASSSGLSVSSSVPSSSFSRMTEYLPAKTKEQMEIVENKLEKESEFVSNVISYMTQKQGKDVTETIYKMMKEAMTNELALQYSFYGQGKKKEKFNGTGMFSCIVAAIRGKYGNVAEESIKKAMMDWINGAKLRYTRAQEAKDSSRNSRTFEMKKLPGFD